MPYHGPSDCEPLSFLGARASEDLWASVKYLTYRLNPLPWPIISRGNDHSLVSEHSP
jgi:hypothetical protein